MCYSALHYNNTIYMKEDRNVWKELLELKTEVLTQIAGSSHDNAKLRDLTEWLGRELDLEAKHKGLFSEAEHLIAARQKPVVERRKNKSDAKQNDGGHQPVNGADSETGNEWTLASLGKQERARVARRAYFARQTEKGKTYRQVGRIYYRNEEGTTTGITFSSDKGGGSWFLNLKADAFQECVFLCQTGPRSVKVIHLPKAFVERHGRYFSKDRKDEIKFNFVLDGQRWLLEVPQPVGPIDVTSFVEREELICARNDYVRYV
jgi:hypothetical protein